MKKLYYKTQGRSLPVTRASICLALCLGSAQAALVADWTADTFVEGNNWTSNTGGIVANLNGSPFSLSDYFNGEKAVDFTGFDHFTVPASSNPLAGATAFTLVAVFEPGSTGASGGGWWNSSGLIGMEQGGDVPDWGLGWNGVRVAGGAGNPESTVFSPPSDINRLQVAMLTWNNSGVERLFINGIEVDSDLLASNAPRNPGDFALGAITSGGGNRFTGKVAELQIHDSDETANATAIYTALRDKYFEDLVVNTATLTPTGGRLVVTDTAESQVDLAGDFVLTVDSTEIPDGAFTVNKVDGVTTIIVTLPLDPNQTYFVEMSIPRVGKAAQVVSGALQSYRLPLAADLPGDPGSPGTWAIREYLTGGAPLPPNAGTIATAVTTITADPEPAAVSGTAPVFNHRDPDTNGVTSIGSFNNDFPILSNAPGDQNWIVVGRTQVTLAEAGTYTFSVHSDDGFAMRVSGGAGGRFVSTGGDGQIDAGDDQTLFRDGGTGDSNSRGTYRFDGAGTYDILYLGWDGGGGGFHEVAWAPGTFTNDRDTNTWQLVGNPADPSVPPFVERFVATLPGPVGTAGNFGVRTYLNTGVGDLNGASNFLATTTRDTSDGITFDSQLAFLNHRDPENPDSGGLVPGDFDFPGNTGADDNNVVTSAKGRIVIPSSGPYTFRVQGDDGFVLRLKGTDGNPDPIFKRVTQSGGNQGGRFDISNLNEIYFNDANTETRATVDLLAGAYDIDFIHYEGVGGFYYELCAAAGEWPMGTTPPTGFPLVGYVAPASSVTFPGIADPGWTVESSLPNRPEDADLGFSIAGAESRINRTLALDPVPVNAISTWPKLDFHDPEDGSQGTYGPTNPWPLNTPGPDDNYAVRATGTLVITQAGDYDLGFQGDDGGYMYIYGLGGNADPVISSIVSTNHPAQAVLVPAPGSSVNNAIRVEVGTGNSRTVIRVPLELGEYQIKTLFYEGGGGSWWEVFGGSTLDGTVPLQLLVQGPGSTATVFSGLTLEAQPSLLDPNDPNFKLSAITVTGNPVTSVSFNIGSQDGATYTVQGSVDLDVWIDIDTNVAATGTSTPVTVDLTEFPALSNQPKVFFRAVFNE